MLPRAFHVDPVTWSGALPPRFPSASATMSEYFSLSDCDVIGFDLDHTLCRYHLKETSRVSVARVQLQARNVTRRVDPRHIWMDVSPPRASVAYCAIEAGRGCWWFDAREVMLPMPQSLCVTHVDQPCVNPPRGLQACLNARSVGHEPLIGSSSRVSIDSVTEFGPPVLLVHEAGMWNHDGVAPDILS